MKKRKMTEKYINEILDKFEKYCFSNGYKRKIPNHLAYMNTKNGNYFFLVDRDKVKHINRSDIEDAYYN